jgi:Flp pilus assembly pilin Flp
MRDMIHQFLRDESGATSIEYSMIAVLIAAVLVGTVHQIGKHVKSDYHAVSHALATQ